MPAENFTVKEQWNITNPTEYVEVVFSGKGMSGEEIRKIIGEFVAEGTDFEVVAKAEDESTGETKVVVKFADKETTKNFIENVSESKGPDSPIKAVGFASGYDESFSSPVALLALAYLAF